MIRIHLPDFLDSSAFQAGLVDSFSLCVVAAIFYLAFGMMAFALDLSLLQAIVSTIFIYSSPLQLILIQGGEQGLALVPVILALNARFALMAATLAPFFQEQKRMHSMIGAILLVPPIFASSLARYPTMKFGYFEYFIGLGLPVYGTAIVCTGLGFMIGSGIPIDIIIRIGGFMVALLFAVMSARLWPQKFEVICFWVGFGFAPIFFLIFGKLALLLGPFMIGGCFVLLQDAKISKKRIT